MKTNYFLTGDVTQMLKILPSKSIDLIFTDPPYNLGKDYGNHIDKKKWDEYEEFTRNWLEETKRILNPTGSLYIFMGVQ